MQVQNITSTNFGMAYNIKKSPEILNYFNKLPAAEGTKLSSEMKEAPEALRNSRFVNVNAYIGGDGKLCHNIAERHPILVNNGVGYEDMLRTPKSKSLPEIVKEAVDKEAVLNREDVARNMQAEVLKNIAGTAGVSGV